MRFSPLGEPLQTTSPRSIGRPQITREVIEVPKKWAVWVIVVTVGVCLVGLSQRPAFQPLRAVFLTAPTHHLRGNLEKAEGSVATNRGREASGFFGSIGFELWAQEKGNHRIQLSTLNLVSSGVKTEDGESGVIGVSLGGASAPVEYNPETGEFVASVEAILHYEQIDEVRGYQKQECRGECDLFEPYTERVAGKFFGRFHQPIEPREEGRISVEGEIVLELQEAVLGNIRQIHVPIYVVIAWFILEPGDVLRIQPVFVGTGPSDPDASGTAFNTLMNHSHDMWNRCGDERCIKFVVNEPIYVDNNAYKTLDNSAEAAAFRAEVNVADAVEIFVAKAMSTSLACSWGGGACFSGGTASSKIVSCDTQMDVPCPCPSACTGYCPCGSCLCGAINPYHLAHELGHALSLPHPSGPSSTSTVGSIMEPSGYCCDNPNAQSAKNCRNASNPLLVSLMSICFGAPDIAD